MGFVVMLDGKDLSELGRAYFPENVRISWSAHSTWIPQLAPPSPDAPTMAPDEPTTAPDDPTTAPDEPTTAPVEPTTAPDEPATTTAAGSKVGTLFSMILVVIGLFY